MYKKGECAMNDNIMLLTGCGIVFFVTLISFALIVSGVKNKGKTVNTSCPKCNHPQSIAKPGFAIAETNEFKPTSDLVSASILAVIGGFFAGAGLLTLLTIIIEGSAAISFIGGNDIVTMAIALIFGASTLIPSIKQILAYNSIKRNGKPATIFTCTKCKHEWYQQENPS
jgi:DNA-directed RNA polymerase subunit M/transcription elongation factor TFIIS